MERARPVVEAHGSAEQRANFFFGIAQLLMRRDRYLVAEKTLELVRAGYAAAQQAGPTSLWWAGFIVGFTLVWHGDLDEATAILREPCGKPSGVARPARCPRPSPTSCPPLAPAL